MAKKKATHNGQKQGKDEPQEEGPTRQPKSEIENLRCLNSQLISTTAKLREQVGSLRQGNDELESKLTLESEESLGLELENGLVSVYMSSQIHGFGRDFLGLVEERDGFTREKEERERKVEALERQVREVCNEKDEVERERKKGECEIKTQKERVEELIGALEREGELLRNVRQERDALRQDLDFHIQEADGFRLKLLNMEKSEGEVHEELKKVKLEVEKLNEEKEEKVRNVESLVQEKSLAEQRFNESFQMVEELKREVWGILREKKQIEDCKGRLELRISELEKDLGHSHDMVSHLQNEVRDLYAKLSEKERNGLEILEKLKEVEREAADSALENKKREKKFENLMLEMDSVWKNLQASVHQLETQNKRITEMVQERIKLEDVKVKQEVNIVELRKKVGELTSSMSTLRNQCREWETANKELNEEVEGYKRSLNGISLEKSTVVKGLDDEKRIGSELKSRVSKLEGDLEGTSKMLEQARNDHSSLIGEKQVLYDQYRLLMKEKTVVEKRLAESQKKNNSMLVKLESADAKAEGALTTLKRISALLCQKHSDGTEKIELLRNESKIEDFQPCAAELQAISSALKDRQMEADKMKEELESLQDSLANANKKKSLWVMFSAATAIFAVSSSLMFAANSW